MDRLNFTLSTIPPAITGLLLLFLTIGVLARQRASSQALSFAAMTTAMSGWMLSFAMMFASTSPEQAMLWARIGLTFVILIPAAMYQFSVVILKQVASRKLLVVSGWIVAAAFIAAALGGDLLLQRLGEFSWGRYPQLGSLGPIFIVWVAAMMLLNLIEYLIDLDSAAPGRRLKIIRLMTFFGVAYLSAIDFLPLLGVAIYPLGFAFTLAFLVLAARSIIEHRLVAISPAYAAREIVDTMADALLVCDERGTIRVVNHAVTTIFGYTSEEIVGRSVELFVTDTEQTLINTERLKRVLGRGTLREQEKVFRTKAGEEIAVSISMSPLKHRGQQVGSVITARDIRERLVAEEQLKASSSLIQSTIESTADGILVINREEKIVLYNQRFKEMWRLSQTIIDTLDDSLVIRSVISQLKEPEDFLKTVRSLYSRPSAESLDILEFNDGRFFERHSVPQRMEGAIVGRVWTFRDVTESRKAEAAVRASERRYRQLFERNLAGVYRNAIDGTILDCNEAFARIFGYEQREEMIGKNAAELYFNRNEREATIEMLKSVRNMSGVELCMQRKDGSRVWVLENASLLEGVDGEPPVMEGTLVDISGLKVAEEQMEFQAYHDVLTCLPNRKLFIDRLSLAVAQSRRTGLPLAVMFLDLDHFKIVNDTLGHTAGDELLLTVAERLAKCIRDGDTVARLGGDEFTVLVSNLNEADDAAKVAEQLLEAIEEPIMLGERQLFVTASIGIALSPTDGTDAETLLKNADSALYRAKDAGRNNYQLCTEEMKVRAIERLSLENNLRRALDRDELRLHYQPVVNLITGRISGLEALIRWQHPERGMTQPDSFIPLAESSRLIVPIGEWVLRTACAQAVQWQNSGLNGFKMSVNLSARQFQQRDLAQTIESIVAESGLDPRHLELEITESTAMQNIDLTVEMLHVFRSMGIAIAIDDFGTGYSSLNYLKRFPINTVKIDKSFVRDLATDASGSAIVSAVIGLARILDLRVIAEGVETEQQLDILYRKQCEEMQGFFFSPPMAAEEVAPFLAGMRQMGTIPAWLVEN